MTFVKNHQEQSASKPPSLSIVFSFRNEEEVLNELVRRTRETCHKEQSKGTISSYEMIFVDDDSNDKSLEILKNQSKSYDDIRIITMSRCFGVSPCVMAGMKYASGDAIVYMDADLQDPPEIISELLHTWQNTPEVEIVHTIRLSREGESKIKLLITKIGYYILNKCASIYLPVEAGDFKLLSRRAVDHLIKFEEIHPFVRGLVCWIGFKQAYVKYHRERRYAGETKFNVFGLKVINNFFGSALISFSSAPLKIASFLGLFTIFINFIIIGYTLLQKIQGKNIAEWTPFVIIVLFIGGVQLFCTGIIGLYLNSIYEQSKNRPNFIVNKTFGFPQSPSPKCQTENN